jgi:NADP-dependent aldehyde dehydrogenase
VLTGFSWLGTERARSGAGARFQAQNPATGAALEPLFHAATAEELEQAVQLAHGSAAAYAKRSGRERGAFLRAIADELERAQVPLVSRAQAETALPEARLQGELGRTCQQLRLFAALVEEGSWVDARLDQVRDAAGQPSGPAIRSLLRPLGPVAVFGASNFPLAFSVAGGDTASALAAGNPVVVKAHPAHPGTSELAGAAVAAAVRACAMPEGTFALLFDDGIEVGRALVRHPLIRAVGFTGSARAGRQLMDLAAARPQPIPVFAEMGSVNPVFVLPRALAERGGELAAGLQQSVTLGAGQFCTKPGVVVVGGGGEAFVQTLAARLSAAAPFTLLTSRMAASYREGAMARARAVTLLTGAPPAAAQPGAAASATLFETDAATFLKNPELADELFGPSTLLVRHQTRAELMKVAHALAGHLTATVLATDDDLREYGDLLAVLAARVGRVVVNGFPTGVAVTDAMVHGGPYPATSDGRSSSVGTRAILRFVRPVCYQGVPDFALPAELQDANPLRIWRRRDGVPTPP